MRLIIIIVCFPEFFLVRPFSGTSHASGKLPWIRDLLFENSVGCSVKVRKIRRVLFNVNESGYLVYPIIGIITYKQAVYPAITDLMWRKCLMISTRQPPFNILLFPRSFLLRYLFLSLTSSISSIVFVSSLINIRVLIACVNFYIFSLLWYRSPFSARLIRKFVIWSRIRNYFTSKEQSRFLFLFLYFFYCCFQLLLLMIR